MISSFAAARREYAAICIAVLCSIYFIISDRLVHSDRGALPGVISLEKYSNALKQILPEDTLILAPHGTEFAATYYTGFASGSHLPRQAKYSMAYLISREEPESGNCVEPRRVEGESSSVHEHTEPPDCLVLKTDLDLAGCSEIVYLSRYTAGSTPTGYGDWVEWR